MPIFLLAALAAWLPSSTPQRSGDPVLTRELLGIERSLWQAWKARDTTFYRRTLLPDAMYVSGGGVSSVNETIHQVVAFSCVVDSTVLDRPETRRTSATDAVLMVHASVTYHCGERSLHAAAWSSTGFTRRAGKWRIAFHQESEEPAARSTTGDDAAAVRSVVGAYLYGLKFNNVDSLRRAFHADARLNFVKRDGSLGQLSQEEWYRGFAASAGKEEEGDLRIASLDISKDVASVKVVETYPKSRYTDYLNLVRWDGSWRIVNKVYTAEPR